MRLTHRIKAILEALATGNVGKVLLQTRKSFALEKFLVHPWARPLRILSNVIAEE